MIMGDEKKREREKNVPGAMVNSVIFSRHHCHVSTNPLPNAQTQAPKLCVVVSPSYYPGFALRINKKHKEP